MEGYKELGITSEHVVSIDSLPLLHKDPFDRLLISQATVEGITLLTNDSVLANYPGPLQLV
jgi:PIN domain nuclease of toxin-antitoxin system